MIFVLKGIISYNYTAVDNMLMHQQQHWIHTKCLICHNLNISNMRLTKMTSSIKTIGQLIPHRNCCMDSMRWKVLTRVLGVKKEHYMGKAHSNVYGHKVENVYTQLNNFLWISRWHQISYIYIYSIPFRFLCLQMASKKKKKNI